MKYVEQSDKYTLVTTKKLTTEPVYYSMDNLTHKTINEINKLLYHMHPTQDNLELILAAIDHNGDNLKDTVDLDDCMYEQLMQTVINPLL